MNPAAPTHELRYRDVITAQSNRRFGLLFAFVCAIVGVVPLWHARSVRTWALAMSGLLAIVTLVSPQLLTPFTRTWLLLGLLLHRISNPVLMFFIYYGVLTPFALLARQLGTLPMGRLKRDRSAATYWISRTVEPPSRMDQQF